MGPSPIQPDKQTKIINRLINNFGLNFRLKNFVTCENTLNCSKFKRKRYIYAILIFVPKQQHGESNGSAAAGSIS